MSRTNGQLGKFLDMIAFSEGTSRVPDSDDGYRVMVGGHVFSSYDDHPNVLVQLGKGLASTAAGRYQLLHRYWVVYKKQLNLRDFGPMAQDEVAIQQIKECHALEDVLAGRIDLAIHKCSRIWASFPGNTYGQHQWPAPVLVAEFTKAGGTLEQSA